MGATRVQRTTGEPEPTYLNLGVGLVAISSSFHVVRSRVEEFSGVSSEGGEVQRFAEIRE